jgi:SAM-dependent methyltransferase
MVVHRKSKLRRMKKWLFRAFTQFFLDPRESLKSVRGLAPFARDAFVYRKHQNTTKKSFNYSFRNLFPQLGDRFESAGTANGHYFHQDIWAARRIYSQRPITHLDIGSRIDGFVGHVLPFMDVTVLDIRPLTTSQPGIQFRRADILNLPLEDSSVESISCLHALEHVGLGRYGDPIDPDGWRQALSELNRVLAKDGRLYFSVPVGRERVEFNAHRVFDPITIINELNDLTLLEFSSVNDAGEYVESVSPESLSQATYSCGLFIFTK